MSDRKKKCLQILKELDRLDSLTDAHAQQVGELYNAWMDFEFIDFGEKEEQLAFALFDHYLPHLAEQILKDTDTNYAGIPRVREILSEANGKVSGIAKKELKAHLLYYRVARSSARRLLQRKVREELEVAVTEGRVRDGAQGFCWSIIEQLDGGRPWSSVQLYTAQKILNGNRDPGEE